MSRKFVLILKGSPRAMSNSSLLADQIAAGASAAGAEVESFALHQMNIQPCDGCDTCKETDGVCVIGDDMQTLYPALRRADTIVVACPVYWFTFNAQTKLCIDRWYALETPQGSALAGKQFVLALVYGDSDPYLSGGINAIHTFQDMCRYLRADLAGIIHGSASAAGEIAQQKDLMDRAYRLGEQVGRGGV